MAIDRYESTFVVDINGNGDFTDLQPMGAEGKSHDSLSANVN